MIYRWLAVALWCCAQLHAQTPDLQQIIAKSVAANKRDFEAGDRYNWRERDKTPEGSKTSQVTMIEGTPYYRLIAENSHPLSPERQQQELKKEQQEIQKRRSESPEARRERIAKYKRERTRDNNMINQLTQAFNFSLVGTKNVRGFDVWVLKATPRPGYEPPNRDARVLTGMEGELWIDQKTCEWVHVRAVVVHPVSIEGFLAQVQPGTQFELQRAPIGNGIWQPVHFAMRAHARVLMMFHHSSEEEETYWDYEPAK
jgi:hypothetical protein